MYPLWCEVTSDVMHPEYTVCNAMLVLDKPRDPMCCSSPSGAVGRFAMKSARRAIAARLYAIAVPE